MLSYCNWLLPLDELDGCPSPHLCKNQSFPKCLKHSVQRDGSSDDVYTIPLFLGLLGVLLLLFCLHSGLAVEWVKVLIKWRISLMWIDVPWFLELVLLKSMLSGLLVKSRCGRYQCSENGANEHLPPSEMDPVQFYTFKCSTNKRNSSTLVKTCCSQTYLSILHTCTFLKLRSKTC